VVSVVSYRFPFATEIRQKELLENAYNTARIPTATILSNKHCFSHDIYLLVQLLTQFKSAAGLKNPEHSANCLPVM